MDNIHFSGLLNVLEEWVHQIRLCTQQGTSNLQIMNLEVLDQLQPKLAELQMSIKNLVLANKGFGAMMVKDFLFHSELQWFPVSEVQSENKEESIPKLNN